MGEKRRNIRSKNFFDRHQGRWQSVTNRFHFLNKRKFQSDTIERLESPVRRGLVSRRLCFGRAEMLERRVLLSASFQTSQYFPTGAGNTWNYSGQYSDDGSPQEATDTRTSAAVNVGGVASVKLTDDVVVGDAGEGALAREFVVNSSGLYAIGSQTIGNSTVTLGSPLHLLKATATVGDVLTWSNVPLSATASVDGITAVGTGTDSGSSTVVGLDEVTLGDGATVPAYQVAVNHTEDYTVSVEGQTVTVTAQLDETMWLAFSAGVVEFSGNINISPSIGTPEALTELFTLDSTSLIGTPTYVFFGQTPGEVIAGVPTTAPVTAQVEDQNFNPVITDSSNVTVSILSGPSGGTLSGTTTVQAVNGVATFTNLVFSKPGQYVLAASDGLLTGGGSNSISAIAGSVDVANWGQISGWAYDPSTPSAPVNVEVVISGGPGAPQVFAANETRSDLQSVLGSSDHGFDYSPPFLSVGNHAVSVWAIEDSGQGVLIGTGTITSQNSMFDEAYYLREYPAVAAAVQGGAFATGYDHYVEYGQHEGYSPSPFWDESWYLEENPDVAAAVRSGKISSGFMQYYDYGQYEGRGGLLYFNTSYYLTLYPSIAAAVQSGSVTSAYEHFLLYGQYAGFSPMKYFASSVCDEDNAYITSAITGEPFTSDYDWYVEYGQLEGAVGSNYYDEATYLADNPDVAAAVRAGDFPDGFIHWLEYGQYEGRTAV